MRDLLAGPEKPPYRIPLMSEIAERPRNGLKVLSTFSGCGGSCLGFKMAGYEVLAASEFVEAAQEVYAMNNPGVPIVVGDVRELEPAVLLEYLGLARGELDVLEGSPPCASFSTAGKRDAGWGEVRKYSDTAQRVDDLFFEYVRLVRGLSPKVFIAENVTGLVKGVAKGYVKMIHREMLDAGYRVSANLLDAQWLGVPQARQRIIFIGVREDLGKEPPTVPYFPYRYTVRDAIPLARRVGTAPPHKDWERMKEQRGHAAAIAQSMVSADTEPCPTIVASGDNKGAGFVEVLVPERVIHDRGPSWDAKGDVSDEPCPTITVGVDGLNSEHYKVEGRVVRIKLDANWVHFGEDRGSIADRPSPVVTAHGVSGGNKGTLGIEYVDVPVELWDEAVERARATGEEVRVPIDSGGPAATLTLRASRPAEMSVGNVEVEDLIGVMEHPFAGDLAGTVVGLEWDKLRPGQQSDVYFNAVKADPTEPCPTVTAAGGTRGTAGVLHPVERRKFTIPELKRICGFPDDFQLTGSYRQQWERLGRAVPPPMMRAVAEAVARDVFGVSV